MPNNGKDILKFHAVYWPAMLMAAGVPLPRKIIAHAHWTVESAKMSKSTGNVVCPVDACAAVGTDSFRYALLRNGNIHHDSDYTSEILAKSINSELCDTFGNLVTRVTAKGCNPHGVRPPFDISCADIYCEAGLDLIRSLHNLRGDVEQYYDEDDYSRGAERVMESLRKCNAFFDACKPWVHMKTLRGDHSNEAKKRAEEELELTLSLSFEAIRIGAIALRPIVPKTADLVLDSLGVDGRDFSSMALGDSSVDGPSPLAIEEKHQSPQRWIASLSKNR